MPPGCKTPALDCPYCAGEGVIRGNADDVYFEFDCVCVGGSAEALLWLTGRDATGEESAT
jgi:hypothetical protein